MPDVVLELPEEVVAQLAERHVSGAMVNRLVVNLIKAWLQADTHATRTSLFSNTAIPFVLELVGENHHLGARLAHLPDDA